MADHPAYLLARQETYLAAGAEREQAAASWHGVLALGGALAFVSLIIPASAIWLRRAR